MKEIFRTKLPFPVYHVYTDKCLIPRMYINIKESLPTWLADINVDISEDGKLYSHGIGEGLTWDEFPNALMNKLSFKDVASLARISIMAEAWKIIYHTDDINYIIERDSISTFTYQNLLISWNAMIDTEFIRIQKSWMKSFAFTECETELCFIPLLAEKRVQFVRHIGKKYGPVLAMAARKYAMINNDPNTFDEKHSRRYPHCEYICGIMSDMGFRLTSVINNRVYFDDGMVHGLVACEDSSIVYIHVSTISDHRKWFRATKIYSENLKYMQSKTKSFIKKVKEDIMNDNMNKAGSGWSYYAGSSFY